MKKNMWAVMVVNLSDRDSRLEIVEVDGDWYDALFEVDPNLADQLTPDVKEMAKVEALELEYLFETRFISRRK